jgi:transcriptional regulator with XRE-family HTH domain
MSSPGGTIYAIGAVGTSYVKIGSTRTAVERRLRALQTGQPFPLQILATVPVGQDLHRIEKQVHTFLEQDKRRGEWFECPMDMATLEALIVRAVAYLAAQEPLADEADDHGDSGAWNIAARVEQCRRERGWTRAELARRSRLNPTHLWKVLDGQRPRVEAETVRRLARAFGVTTDYLLGMDVADAEEEAATLATVKDRELREILTRVATKARAQEATAPQPPPAQRQRPRKAASVG